MTTPGSFTTEDETDPVKVPPFTEGDLRTLKANQNSPTHPLMELMGTLTLHRLSPFKLSADQTSSCANLLAKPWPKKGEAVDTTYHAVLRVFNSMASAMHWSEPATKVTAEGLMVVIGTCYAAVLHKVSELSKVNTDDNGDLYWAWDIAVERPLFNDALKGALSKRTSACIGIVIAWCEKFNSDFVSETQGEETPTILDVGDLHSAFRRAVDIAQYRLSIASEPAQKAESAMDSVTSKSAMSTASTERSWLSSWLTSIYSGDRSGSPPSASDNTQAQSGIFGINLRGHDGKLKSGFTAEVYLAPADYLKRNEFRSSFPGPTTRFAVWCDYLERYLPVIDSVHTSRSSARKVERRHQPEQPSFPATPEYCTKQQSEGEFHAAGSASTAQQPARKPERRSPLEEGIPRDTDATGSKATRQTPFSWTSMSLILLPELPVRNLVRHADPDAIEENFQELVETLKLSWNRYVGIRPILNGFQLPLSNSRFIGLDPLERELWIALAECIIDLGELLVPEYAIQPIDFAMPICLQCLRPFPGVPEDSVPAWIQHDCRPVTYVAQILYRVVRSGFVDDVGRHRMPIWAYRAGDMVGSLPAPTALNELARIRAEGDAALADMTTQRDQLLQAAQNEGELRGAAQTTLAEVQEQLRRSQRRNTTLQTEIDTAIRTAGTTRETNLALRRRIHEMEAHGTRLLQQNQDLAGRYDLLQESFQDQNQRLQDTLAEHMADEEIRELEASYYRAQLAGTEDIVSGLGAVLLGEQEGSRRIEVARRSLEQTVLRLNRERNELLEELEDSRDGIQQLEEELVGATMQVDAMTLAARQEASELEQVRASLATAQQQATNDAHAATANRLSLEEANTKIQQLQKDLAEAKAAKASEEVKAKKTLAETKVVQADLAKVVQEKNDALQKLQTAQIDLDDARTQISSVEKARDLAIKDKATAEAERGTRESKLAETKTTLTTVETTHRVALKRLKETEGELVKVKAERDQFEKDLDNEKAKASKDLSTLKEKSDQEVATAQDDLTCRTPCQENFLGLDRLLGGTDESISYQLDSPTRPDDASCGSTTRETNLALRRRIHEMEAHGTRLLQQNQDLAGRYDLLQESFQDQNQRLQDTLAEHMADEEIRELEASYYRAQLAGTEDIVSGLGAVLLGEQEGSRRIEVARRSLEQTVLRLNRERNELLEELEDSRDGIQQLEEELVGATMQVDAMTLAARQEASELEQVRASLATAQQQATNDAHAATANRLSLEEANTKIQQLQKDLAEAKAAKASEEVKAKKTLAETKVVQADLAKVVQEKNDALQKLQTAQTDLDDARTQISSVEKARDLAIKDKATAEAERGTRESKLAETKTTLTTVETTHRVALKRLKETEGELVKVKAERDQFEKDLDNEKAKASKDLSTLKEKSDQEVATAQDDLKALQKRTDNLEKELAQVKHDRKQLEGSLAEAQKVALQRDNAVKAKDTAETSARDLQTQLDTAEECCKTLEQRIKDLTDDLGKVNASRKQLSADLATARERVTELEPELQKRKELQAQLFEATANASRADQTRTDLEAELAEVTARWDLDDENAKTPREHLRQANNERSQLSSDLETARGRIAEMEAARATVAGELNTMTADRDRLAAELVQCQQQLANESRRVDALVVRPQPQAASSAGEWARQVNDLQGQVAELYGQLLEATRQRERMATRVTELEREAGGGSVTGNPFWTTHVQPFLQSISATMTLVQQAVPSGPMSRPRVQRMHEALAALCAMAEREALAVARASGLSGYA